MASPRGDTTRSFAGPQPSASYKAGDVGRNFHLVPRDRSPQALSGRGALRHPARPPHGARGQAGRRRACLSQGHERGSNGAAETAQLGPHSRNEGSHAMPRTREYDFQLFNVRLPAGTVERIQRYRDYLNQTQPGIEASASTAARMLLFRALEQVEEEMGIPKKVSRSKGDLVLRKKT